MTIGIRGHLNLEECLLKMQGRYRMLQLQASLAQTESTELLQRKLLYTFSGRGIIRDRKKIEQKLLFEEIKMKKSTYFFIKQKI